MMRFGAVLLASLLLLQNLHLSVSDLAGIDELLEHARYHKQEFGDDFLSFLSKHYGDQRETHHKNHQEEQSEHDQLPFQQITHVHGLQTLNVVAFTLLPSPLAPGPEESGNFHYPGMSSSVHASGIFQPPRLS